MSDQAADSSPLVKGANFLAGSTLISEGTVRYVYRHMAFLGDESVWASAASECAAAPGCFWEYHDLLFTHTDGRNKGVFTRPNLKRYAADLGTLDTAAH